MHIESEFTGLEGRQVCTRWPNLPSPPGSNATTHSPTRYPWTQDIEEKHRISMLVAFHDADVDRMYTKPDATPLRTLFKDERSCVRTELRSSTGTFLIV
jgi:hypothetical protein